MMGYLFDIYAFVFGSLIGSFLNVCIVRMPKEESVVFPSSHCVSCKKPIAWYDNIPFVSFILLGGRCRFCKKRISIRYFIVETFTALSFLFFYRFFGLHWILAPYLVFLCGLIVASFIDIEHRIIPDEISLGGIGAGFIFSCLLPQMHLVNSHWMAALQSFLGILVGGGSIYLMGLLGDFIFKKESMGGGDVKLQAMIGAFLGWKLALITFFMAPLFGAVVGIIVKIKTKESVIPYGPFLSLAALISLFFGPVIIEWIKSSYGLY